MSELKAYNSERIYWAVEQVDQEAGDIEGLHLDDNLFYLKSEADKVIAELRAQIVQADSECAQAVKELKGSTKNFILDNHLKSEALRHAKYKRCLAMGAYWVAVSYQCVDEMHRLRAEKRHKKWLELAERYK